MTYRPPATPRKSNESRKRTTRARSVAGSPRLSDSDDTSSLPDDEPRMLDEQVFTQKSHNPRPSSSSQGDAANNVAASSSNTNTNPSTIPDAAKVARPAISFTHTNLENKSTGLAPNHTPAPTPYVHGDIPPESSQETLDIANRSSSYSVAALQDAWRSLHNDDLSPDERARLE
ncbi:hypothetical protein BGZ79_005146 [Entomortierella chlamydospora]|nr:hypothetical protein BGZ79_005146 [Entomortierella chlamydospora]